MASPDSTTIGARIDIHRLNEAAEQLPLGEAPLVIGRDPACDVTAAGLKTISRRHAEIFKDGGYWIRDLGSANGVFVNGARISDPVRLTDGDEVSLGLMDRHSELRIRFFHPVPVESPAEPGPLKPLRPYVVIRRPDGGLESTELSEDSITAGRSGEADLRLPENLPFIAPLHFRLERDEGGYRIRDLGGGAGTLLNNRRLEPELPAPLNDGDIIRIGDEKLGDSLGLIYHNPVQSQKTGLGWQPLEASVLVPRETEFTIGRHSSNEMVLPSLTVSRRHAVIRSDGERTTISDLDSRNGTFVNGERIRTAELFDGDLIEIGENLLLFQGGEITPYTSQGFRLDVVGLRKSVSDRGGTREILHGIDLTVLPKEFLAVVGASGAGKTTFMRALNGTSPGDGQVLVNGRNLYHEYDLFRQQLGYVPQFEILHNSLTVDQALDYAARLRLPPGLGAAERKARIDRALQTVSMDTPAIRRNRIANLSGGQRKRVSIAAELLADPRLIFLDEATSGLDPGLEKKMMYTFRRMADEGRTIVLITHATSNIVQADHVAFLTQGRLVYFGPSGEALPFFEVGEFADIYERIEGAGPAWEQTFREEKPANYRRYIAERSQSRRAMPLGDVKSPPFRPADLFRQFAVLTERAFRVIASDWVTLLLLMLLFPLTAALQLVIATPHVITGDPAFLADPAAAAVDLARAYIPFPDTNTFVFVMGLEAVLVGLFVPSTELLKERSIYRRERMINLRIPPYLGSKVIVFTLFSAVQVLLYMLVLTLGVEFPESGVFLPGPLEIFITLFLTMLAGNGLGLVVSALSRNNEIAIYLLTLMLFFQFFFAGTVFDLRGAAAEPLSYLTSTRWSLIALGSTVDMEGITESTVLCSTQDNPLTPEPDEVTRCFHYPEAVDDLMLPYGKAELLVAWLVLLGTMLFGLAVTGLLVRRLDTV